MANLFMRLLLFLSSYFPLLAIIAVRVALKGHHVWAGIISGIGLLSLIALWGYFKLLKSRNPRVITVQGIVRKDGEAMSYIVSYLLPFVALPSTDIADSISLGIFLIVLCVLYVNSGMLHINPTLNLARWHIYEVTLSNGETCSLITKRRLRKLKELQGVPIGEDIYLEVISAKENSAKK